MRLLALCLLPVGAASLSSGRLSNCVASPVSTQRGYASRRTGRGKETPTTTHRPTCQHAQRHLRAPVEVKNPQHLGTTTPASTPTRPSSTHHWRPSFTRTLGSREQPWGVVNGYADVHRWTTYPPGRTPADAEYLGSRERLCGCAPVDHLPTGADPRRCRPDSAFFYISTLFYIFFYLHVYPGEP